MKIRCDDTERAACCHAQVSYNALENNCGKTRANKNFNERWKHDVVVLVIDDDDECDAATRLALREEKKRIMKKFHLRLRIVEPSKW